VVGARTRKTLHVEQQALEDAVEQRHPPDGDRAHRVAVVGLGQRSEARLLRSAPLLPVLISHLQRDLDRGAARVRVEDPGEPLRRDADQRLGQLDGGDRGQPEESRVRHPVQLRADRLVDLPLAVPVHVAPERADAIEVAVAQIVDELVALRALDDQRIVRRPDRHLGEGMPDMRPVQGEQLLMPR
jgi:hypothetical protein